MEDRTRIEIEIADIIHECISEQLGECEVDIAAETILEYIEENVTLEESD